MVRLSPHPHLPLQWFSAPSPAFLRAMPIVQVCADGAQPGWLALRSFLQVILLPIVREVFVGMWDWAGIHSTGVFLEMVCQQLPGWWDPAPILRIGNRTQGTRCRTEAALALATTIVCGRRNQLQIDTVFVCLFVFVLVVFSFIVAIIKIVPVSTILRSLVVIDSQVGWA